MRTKNISERLKQIISEKKLSIRAFAKEINCADTTIGALIKGKAEPGYSILFSIVNRYPEISPEWLLTGEGYMLRNPKQVCMDETKQVIEDYSYHHQEQMKDISEFIKEKNRQLEQLLKANMKLTRMLEEGGPKEKLLIKNLYSRRQEKN
ncbi:MAG: helix-turn-helix transcriptional regulator [Rikenellaceae bacterium]